MGNYPNTLENVDAFIQLKRDFYIAGEYLDGIFVLSCSK